MTTKPLAYSTLRRRSAAAREAFIRTLERDALIAGTAVLTRRNRWGTWAPVLLVVTTHAKTRDAVRAHARALDLTDAVTESAGHLTIAF